MSGWLGKRRLAELGIQNSMPDEPPASTAIFLGFLAVCVGFPAVDDGRPQHGQDHNRYFDRYLDHLSVVHADVTPYPGLPILSIVSEPSVIQVTRPPLPSVWPPGEPARCRVSVLRRRSARRGRTHRSKFCESRCS